MNTVKSTVTFSKISTGTLQMIKDLRKEKKEQSIFCYSYDGDLEFLFYFFLSFFLVFPALFFMANINSYDITFVVLVASCYLFGHWFRHYYYETESCLFCDFQYLVYFDFRGLTIYNLLDADGDTTIKKIDFVKGNDHEGLVIKFLTGEKINIYAQEGLNKYIDVLHKIQYNEEKSMLSSETLTSSRHPLLIVTTYDVIYYSVLIYFLCGGSLF
ncbi:hypothetical protein [Candidatus Uabimicrobium sp. HlEnr_7]|uniref:hypothetical protein n=1 Tax=Candidatus Uabimicrobium helgolandensis TaxID=3095367 RepID=UPI0035591A3A